ncbi:Bacteriophage abortive infection AbiH [Butyrivibrio fibrisolvens]|uniref:Bacteriophage abortive infection AbiH n=1 Tax=Butyrivibrio fibrisolvens TaxID=831 RepID=A0A1H9W4L8_BUTFI|nr:AbiH family protein [Butyrivibrio fibrisolvens]SES28729.1 Bacteriophage abortive infection AbiH [Butyrivibrio fibrisolvens]
MNNNNVNLFVIGNGFDLAHNLPTNYSDFKEFLKEKCDACRNVYDDNGKLKQKCPELPGPQIHYSGKDGIGNVLADYKQEAAVLYWLIERAAKRNRQGIKDWADFEELLMKIDFDSVDIEEEYDMQALCDTVADLSGMFFEWITKAVVIDETLPKLTSICQVADADSDIAINFNYTETLETVYGFKPQNICYIHGKRTQNPPAEYEQQYIWSLGEGKNGLVLGGPEPKNPRKDPYISIRGDLIKNTEMTIFSNEAFFGRIKDNNIQNIYSYGFSFSRADMPYIRKICDELNNRKAIWHIFIYDNKDIFRYKCRLRMGGFKGRIKILSC